MQSPAIPASSSGAININKNNLLYYFGVAPRAVLLASDTPRRINCKTATASWS